MKLLHLVFSRLYRHFQTNRLIFILYVIGSITCCTAFLYFYGNMMPYMATNTNEAQAYRSYEIALSEPRMVDEAALSAVLKQDPQDILLAASIPPERIRIDDAPLMDTKADLFGFQVEARWFDRLALPNYRGRAEFTQQELESGAPVALLSGDTSRGEAAYPTLSIDASSFDIVGYTMLQEGNSGVVLPIDRFLALRLPVQTITVVLPRALSADGNLRFVQNVLMPSYPGAAITDPSRLYTNSSVNAMTFVMLAVVYGAALLSFLFLSKYMADQSRDENVVYSLVGASRRKVVGVAFMENLVLSMSTCLLSILMHVSLYRVFFDKINLYRGLVYHVSDYAFLFVLTVFLSALMLLPFLRGYARHSLIACRNRSSTR